MALSAESRVWSPKPGSRFQRDIERPVGMVARKGQCTTLILGERGSGKEVVAREIHRRSPRSKKPFVVVDCTAIPCNLFESLLFGHCAGTFTGAKPHTGLLASANGGAVFFDEIGCLCLERQAKLLLFLNDRKVRKLGEVEGDPIDVHIIAATNENLARLCTEEKFRPDLYDRLRTFPIRVPPLRERVEEIPELADHFLRKYCEREEIPYRPLDATEVRELERFPWPGNVRHLEHVIERFVVFECLRGQLTEILREETPEAELKVVLKADGSPPIAIADPGELGYTALEAEERAIRRAFMKAKGNKQKTADLLGVSLKTLYNWLKRESLADIASDQEGRREAC